MSQTKRTYVGDYVVLKQIGSGSFSTVWLARHRIDGTEVAIKDIIMSRLNSKLHESLKSEIYILKRINHPNIIRLHDLIEEPGKMYIILEYCKGGDLSKYIQQQRGKIPEATAKHFMLQLAEGLKVLRDNNLIHRDLKPQNLLLTTNDDKSMLKIADFGFARSLQPRGLAETLCGSPLYMAPEIMQLQKYDAKADLWSVGTILFQLVTGKPPYTGINQIQLLQNIIKSGELQFPPEAKDLSPHCVDLCKKLLRRNPVERLTFEEFFNHPYFADTKPDESSREGAPDDSPRFGGNTVESSPDYCLPFILDEDSSGTDGSPNPRRPNMASAYRFSLPDRKESFSLANQKESHSQCYSSRTAEITGSKGGSHHLLPRNMKDSRSVTDPGPLGNHPKVMDSLESIDQDYVIVSGPPLDSYSSVCASKPNNLPSKANSPARDPGMMNTTSAPRSINDVASGRVTCTTSQEKQISALKTLEGSVNIEQPASDAMTRIKSLQHFASSIAELVNEKIDGGKHLDAFSVQLVVLAIWKQALHICHTDAASASEVNPWHNTPTSAGVPKAKHSIHTQGHRDAADLQGLHDISSQIESAFLHEVQNAEELAKVVLPGNVEIPDAMEVIYQSALDLGRHGAVDEYMGKTDNAVFFYSKAVSLLQFILVEAPCLTLNPPFSLTNADRYRIKNYIDVLSNRQSISESQRIALFKTEDQPIIRS